MSGALLLAVGGLTAVGLYFLTGRSLSRIVLGYALLGHAAVVALVAAGGAAGQPPIAGRAEAEDMANPLPQALTLTAIVISFGLTLFLLALAKRQRTLSGDDLVEDDLEDYRVANPRLAARSRIAGLRRSRGGDDRDAPAGHADSHRGGPGPGGAATT